MVVPIKLVSRACKILTTIFAFLHTAACMARRKITVCNISVKVYSPDYMTQKCMQGVVTLIIWPVEPFATGIKMKSRDQDNNLY